MRTKKKLAASILALTMTAFFLMISIRAWFSEGDIARMLITTGLSDCEVELFQIDDFNYDGIYDGNYTFDDFSNIITTVDSINENKYHGLIGDKLITIEQEQDSGLIYRIKDSNNENELVLRHIKNDEETVAEILFNDMYPSKTVSFAFSIRSGNPLNVGRVSFMLDKSKGAKINGLGNVLTLNFSDNSIFLYGDNSTLKTTTDTGEGDLINLDSESIVLEGNDVIWVFFSFKFPTVDEILEMKMTDDTIIDGIDNNFITTNFMYNNTDGTGIIPFILPKFHINYELTDVKKNDT